MSGEIDDLYVVLRGQTAQLTDALLQAGVKGEELAATFVSVSAEVEASVARMAEASKFSLDGITRSAVVADEEFVALARTTIIAADEMEAATARAAASVEAMGASIDAAGGQAKMKKLQTGMLIGAAAVAFLGYESVKAAGNFESATTRLVTSAGETQSNLNGVRQGILAMAGQVGDSADELAKAMYVIESGGQHGADGLTVLKAAAQGAKAENADLTVVADAVTSVLQDYHLKASDAAMVTSKLVAAVGAGKTNFQDLSGSLHSVLPLASSLHISLSDITGALASMTVHGMSADQAAQNLNDTIKHMAAPTSVQVKELGQLGISASGLTDMLGTKGITGTLQYLSETILQHMGPSGRVLLDAFNKSKDAANDANIMVSKMPQTLQALAKGYQSGAITLSDWRQQLKALPPEQANLLNQWATLQNRATGFNDVLKSGSPAAQTYQDALRRVTGDATGLNTALMLTGDNTDYVNNAVKTVAGATVEAGNNVKGWSDIQGTFNQKMSEAKAGFGALAISVGEKLLPAVSKFAGWMATAAQWLAKHQAIATVLAVVLGVLAVGFTVAAIAIWIMNSALLANPITWIILAIVLLIAIIVVLVMNWKKVWGAIWDFMKAIGAWFAGPFANFFVMLWHGISDSTKAMHAVWLAVWGAIWDFLKGIGHWFSHDFVDFFVNAYHRLQGKGQEFHDWLLGKWNALIAFVTGLPGRITAAASGMWDGIKEAFRSAINWLIDHWNGLKLSLPSIDTHIPGVGTIGGFTLQPPQIPRLAQGAFIPPVIGGSLGILGEAGVSEYALPEPKLARLLDQAISRAGAAVIHNHNHIYIDGKELHQANMRQAGRHKLRNANTGLT